MIAACSTSFLTTRMRPFNRRWDSDSARAAPADLDVEDEAVRAADGGGPGGPGSPAGPAAGQGRGLAADPASRTGGPAAAAPAGADLDPLIGMDDPRKPLRSRLLAVPALKSRYLKNVRAIAENWLDWQKLKPIVDQYRSLIEPELEADTRKLTSLASFKKSVSDIEATGTAAPRGRPSLGLNALRNKGVNICSTIRKSKMPPPDRATSKFDCTPRSGAIRLVRMSTGIVRPGNSLRTSRNADA